MTKRKFGANGFIFLLSLLFAFVGFVIYLVNSTTGYLSGTALNYWIIILSVIAIVLGALLLIFRNSMEGYESLVMIVIGVLLAVSVCLFIDERKTLAADVYFIPVNYPQAEADALYLGIVGVAFYIVSIITLVVSSMIGIEGKEVKKDDIIVVESK